jgi:poly(A) polymerase
VYDPLGGLSDLRAGRVRFVGDPAARIAEDYLRILRFFRFSADYAAGAFDAGGVAACIAGRSGLLQLSRERVQMELLRILVARRAGEAIGILDESGMVLLLLGGVTRRARFERLCEIEASLQLAPDPIFRLAALGLFVGEDAVRLGEWLRLSSQEAKDLLDLSAPGPAVYAGLGKAKLEALLYRLGKRLYLGRLLLSWADSDAAPGDAGWHGAAGLAASWQRPIFPLGGADLIGLGWKPGPALGVALKELEEQWIAGGFGANRETLLGLARKKAGPPA